MTRMIPWQRAVYTRRGANDIYTFSHIESITQEKRFPRSLSVPDMAHFQSTLRPANLEALQDAIVLVLVTGRWAHHVSLNSFTPTGGRCPPPRYSLYDHLERLSAARCGSKHCSELTQDYQAVHYHSTLCHYAQGDNHSWGLFSVVPVLSDTVILPRLLDPGRIKSVLASFSRATRKCMRDSLIIAGTAKYKENTLARTESRPLIDESKPVDQHTPVPSDSGLHH